MKGYVGLRIAFKPPITAPYSLIIFASLYIAPAAFDILLFTQPFSGLAFDVTHITFSTLFLFLASNLPMKAVLPAPNVASPSDVGFT